MITVNPALMNEVNRSIVARFKKGLARVAPFWPSIAQREVSTTKQNIYPIIGAMGTLREWVGNRIAEELRSSDFAIKNRDFEKTLRIPINDIKDDQFGFYGNEAEMLGDAANRHPDKLVAALIEGGFVNLGADGVAFFATTHPKADGTTFSNKGTTALSATSFAVAMAQMQKMTDDGGEVLDVFRNPSDVVLAVPPELQETGRLILNADTIPNAAGTAAQSNVWKGSAELLVLPRLTDPNDWYLFDKGQVLKPFIMQFREDPTIISKTDPNDENVYRRKEAEWGVQYRGEGGYSLPQLAFGAHV